MIFELKEQRMKTLIRHLCLIILVQLCAGSAASWAKGPRFYFEVRSVKIPSGTKITIKDKAKAILLSEFKKQPQVVTELSDPPPQGGDLEKALKARGLEGFGLVLRITKNQHTLQPPPSGKVYKVLMVEVAVAIDAEKIPSGQMAIAGEGTAQVGTEVSKLNEKELMQLTEEALTESIGQAIRQTLAKLTPSGKAPATHKKARRKKR
jgi:hypothetical protein